MFTQTEIEAARQLVELSNSTTCTHLHQVEDVLAEVEEDERLRRRNNRYRYIQDLYNVTQPLRSHVESQKLTSIQTSVYNLRYFYLQRLSIVFESYVILLLVSINHKVNESYAVNNFMFPQSQSVTNSEWKRKLIYNIYLFTLFLVIIILITDFSRIRFYVPTVTASLQFIARHGNNNIDWFISDFTESDFFCSNKHGH